ncbi:hypothetical protein [Bacillus sp. NTK034]|nr:hypothetical protein [Bacillus sp. NTK034]MBN8200516.1 hypothetical protein [Bacillus sp. NTK034]
MNAITVFHIHNKYFLPTGDSVREIPFATVMEWQRTGSDVQIKEVEQYV